MTKAQLINLVLDQLLDQIKESPESFETLDPNVSINDTIIWKPKIKSKIDPNNPSFMDPSDTNRCVIITFHKAFNTLTCHIGKSVTMAAGNQPDASVDVKKPWMMWSKEYRKYNKIMQIIKEHSKNKEAMKFLKKLCDVFPGVFESYILGKRDE